MLPTLLLWLSIVINEFMPAPSSGTEWVELYNAGSDSVDLSNWVIDDDTLGGTRVVIASGTTLPPGGFLVVAIPSAILNNSGDAVTLSNASGTIVDQIGYTSSTSNQAILRIPDGASTITNSASASPGSANAPTPSSSPTYTSTPEPSTPTALPLASMTVVEPTATTEPSTTPAVATATSQALPSQTPSPTKTETPSKTPSPTKTETPSKTPSPTKTETPSKTPSPTKTASLTRTLSPTKTLSPSKTRSATKTLSPSKTPSETKTTTPSRTTVTTKPQNWLVTPTSHQWLHVALINRTAVATMCQRHAHSLAGWWLTVDDTAQEIDVDQRCTTAIVPATAHLSLVNPHQYPVATVVVADALCASDIAWCQPVATILPPATPRLILTRSLLPPESSPATTIPVASEPVEVPLIDPKEPHPPRWPLLQIGALCILAGILGLRTLASAPSDVLYSEADADAASSADPIAQRVEDGESSTNDQRERHR
jgi:hypothetical protein